MIPKGFQLAGVRCGLKNKRNDLGLIVCDRPAKFAGVFTQNLISASSVEHTRRVAATGQARALVVNSGNANCCTGAQGDKDTAEMARLTAQTLGITPEAVAVASTGVIGRPLDMGKVTQGIYQAAEALGDETKPFMDAILTTDLVEKSASVRVEGGSIFGIAKGSGMIAPNMATMLAFLLTDLDLSEIDLPRAFKTACDGTFNCLTVDSDTSTNDMALLFASGASKIKPDSLKFQRALEEICDSLARQIARDGEGATKLIEVRVTGTEDPKRVARTIADSPLVKTAMFGCDPNWGRILAAAGRSGVPFDPQTATLKVTTLRGEFLLFENGRPTPFDEKRVSAALKSDHIALDLDLGEGETARMYTCDLGYGYVRINAEYHT